MSVIRALLLSVMLLAITAALATAARAGYDGGWNLIEDMSDPHIQELGRWAVAKHTRQANDELRFGRVTRGEMQIVGGVNYNLVLDATNANGVITAYGAFVYEAMWTNTRELMSFSALN